MNTKKAIITAFAVLIGSTAALANNTKMMTFKTTNIQHPITITSNQTQQQVTAPGVVPRVAHASCGAAQCDPYQGNVNETNKKVSILCFVPGNSPMPALYQKRFQTIWDHSNTSNHAVQNPFYYNGWSGGKLGITRNLKQLLADGIITSIPLASQAEGDAACVDQLSDSNARMAEFHDGGGGWGIGGDVHPNSKHKAHFGPKAGNRHLLVTINDQSSNPWD